MATLPFRSLLEVKMRKIKKIDFMSLLDELQKYAEKEFDGNLNAAVRFLVKKGLMNEQH